MRNESVSPDLTAIGALLADRTRTQTLTALLDGRAWTLSELAGHCGVVRSTMSEHADRLVAGGLVTEARQGRHRYLRLAGEPIADLVERIGNLAGPTHPKTAPGLTVVVRDERLRAGRTCYRHLAGQLGVRLAGELGRLGVISPGWQLTEPGRDWFAGWGLRWTNPSRRPLVRPCLDWTERRDHLAGLVADEFCAHLLRCGWLVRLPSGRAVRLSESGRAAWRAHGLAAAESP